MAAIARIAVVGSAALCSTGCAATSLTRISNRPWHAIETAHVHLETDAALQVGEEHATLLEREVLESPPARSTSRA